MIYRFKTDNQTNKIIKLQDIIARFSYTYIQKRPLPRASIKQITIKTIGYTNTGPAACNCENGELYIEGILPKGPYLPCVSMAGRPLWQDTIDMCEGPNSMRCGQLYFKCGIQYIFIEYA